MPSRSFAPHPGRSLRQGSLSRASLTCDPCFHVEQRSLGTEAAARGAVGVEGERHAEPVASRSSGGGHRPRSAGPSQVPKDTCPVTGFINPAFREDGSWFELIKPVRAAVALPTSHVPQGPPPPQGDQRLGRPGRLLPLQSHVLQGGL